MLLWTVQLRLHKPVLCLYACKSRTFWKDLCTQERGTVLPNEAAKYSCKDVPGFLFLIRIEQRSYHLNDSWTKPPFFLSLPTLYYAILVSFSRWSELLRFSYKQVRIKQVTNNNFSWITPKQQISVHKQKSYLFTRTELPSLSQGRRQRWQA